MRRSLKNIVFLLVFLMGSCNRQAGFKQEDIKYHYPNDSAISDSSGHLKDSLAFFYPSQFIHNADTVNVAIDTFELNWFSSVLYCFEEPVLYNYYLGHDIYRFLYLRSFHRPLVFILNKEGTQVWLTTKILNKEPQFEDEILLSPFDEKGNASETFRTDTLSKADRHADIIYSQTIALSEKEWKRFESLADSGSFWTMPYEVILQIDGSVGILEGHKKNNYWFTNQGDGRAGRYLLKLSGLKEKVY